MTPLDLTQAPPRSPNAALRGLCMLPRMIDIARAQLPGGRVSDYQIGQGFSGLVLARLGLDAPEFIRQVEAASDDDDVVERTLRGRGEADFAGFSTMLQRATVANVPPDLRAAFEQYYGCDQPADRVIFELLEADDARVFRSASA